MITDLSRNFKTAFLFRFIDRVSTAVILYFTDQEVSPAQIDDTKIENQSQNANNRSNDYIPNNQADEKGDRTSIQPNTPR